MALNIESEVVLGAASVFMETVRSHTGQPHLLTVPHFVPHLQPSQHFHAVSVCVPSATNAVWEAWPWVVLG